MEQYQSTTVEMDNAGFDELKNQILTSKTEKDANTKDIREKVADATEPEKNKRLSSSAKKFVFRKGDNSVELEDDYEVEIMADKKATKLTLRELKERAAGEIAVKNRMHSLAEEKKRVQSTFKEFAELAKTDPLAALEFISSKAKESDSEFEYAKYIEKLAEQAEKLGQMTDEQRKAFELERKLEKAEQNLSRKEREAAVVLRKQELLTQYPEIGDSQFGEMVDAILSHEELIEGLESEDQIMDRVEELIQETLTQRDIMSVIREINPEYLGNNELIFSLSDQIRQNPDLEEQDIRDIIAEIIAPPERAEVPVPQRTKDIKTLSRKARQADPLQSARTQNMSEYDVLKEQLIARKGELSKTPLYAR